MNRLAILLFVNFFSFQITGFCQIITTIAGGDTSGFSGDGDSLIHAKINAPLGICFDGLGNMYFSDDYNFRIRKTDTFSIVNTVAGNGLHGFSGDYGSATSAEFGITFYIAVGSDGSFYIPDPDFNRIRKVDTTGIISTIAGNEFFGNTGDGGLATNASIGHPTGVAFDCLGNLYFTDAYYSVVRKINTDGIISTITGTGVNGYSGDGGDATAATLYGPADLTVDNLGNIFISDLKNNVIRKINSLGIISTFAGTGAFGYSGDGGSATNAHLFYPEGIITDELGNIYFSDEENNCVRKVDSSGVISTIVGNGTLGFSGDEGMATEAQLNNPAGLAFDRHGNLFITDCLNNRIRKVTNVTKFTDVKGPVREIDATVYPNPVTRYLTVEKANGRRILVYNLIGQIFFSTDAINSTEMAIDMSNWENGVYFIEIVEVETGSRTMKKIFKD